MFFSLSGGTCRYECGAPLTGPLVNWVVLFSPSISVQYGCSGVLVLAVGLSCDVQVCIYVATLQDAEVLLLDDTCCNCSGLRIPIKYVVLVDTTVIMYTLYTTRAHVSSTGIAGCAMHICAHETTSGGHTAHHIISPCYGLCCLVNSYCIYVATSQIQKSYYLMTRVATTQDSKVLLISTSGYNGNNIYFI